MDRNRYDRAQSSSSNMSSRSTREPSNYNSSEHGRRESHHRRNPSPDWRRSSSHRSNHQRDQDASYRSRSDNNRYPSNADSYNRGYSQSRNSRPPPRRSRSRERSHISSISSTSESRQRENIKKTERQQLLEKWRKDYCKTGEDMKRKLEELEDEVVSWIRSSPADIYYTRVQGKVVNSTAKLDKLCNLFEENLIQRSEKVREGQTPYSAASMRKKKVRPCRHADGKCCSSSDSSSEEELEEDKTMEELTRKTSHPYRLHTDLWHNEAGEMNDGPLCRCSAKSQRSGIRHGIYPGETGFEKCQPNSNNADRLHHYRIVISPPTNFLTRTPTMIRHDEHEFIFEGFSLLTHEKIPAELPICKVIRFNIEYTIEYVEEVMPENFTIRELDSFYKFLFLEVLELVDFSINPSLANIETCPCFHFYPRFVRELPENGKEVLAMSEVLRYLVDNSFEVVGPNVFSKMERMRQNEWQDYADQFKEMVLLNPGMKPCAVRLDQLDRSVDGDEKAKCFDEKSKSYYPAIVHFGIRPPQLSYAGDPKYQKAWREYVKYRHLIANMSKPSTEDKNKLKMKESRLQEMRNQGRMKRNVTVVVSSKNFYSTGIMCDVVQHAMLIPVLTNHLRFHRSLKVLEEIIGYKFKNRYLLQLALTHPSYKENFGTNPDHARNSLTNCGIRQPEYGDKKIHYMNTRKRGINTLISIMSRFGKDDDTDSNITHNERLEFLGDAVVEFITSIHLFHLFPDLEEGGLATYRAAIVQNQHLAVLAKRLGLEKFMLYAHGSDLCHDVELRHAMANCFEALLGSLFLDGGIQVADDVFSIAVNEDAILKEIWDNYPRHPLQLQEPDGDRKWIEKFEFLQKLTTFEEAIGVEFTHIRLLARAFTDRSMGYTNLTLGSNQRMEFLGDTVLQLICSEFLYRHFPEHHEGHLSLLRSSLVNNRTQAVVCDDLGMTKYAVYSNPKGDMKTKDRADLLEALLGALYVDKGLVYCETFCQVCLFPRLQDFIMNQDWNDPKSKLQQCCLTLRTMDGNEPDIPYYKVVESTGPTNTRVYTVAVYFRNRRLADATGHSIQEAEMNAARKALENSKNLFPQLDHQKRVIEQSLKKQNVVAKNSNDSQKDEPGTSKENSAFESRLPKQYQKHLNIVSDASDISSSDSEDEFDSDASIDEKLKQWKPQESEEDEPPAMKKPRIDTDAENEENQQENVQPTSEIESSDDDDDNDEEDDDED